MYPYHKVLPNIYNCNFINTMDLYNGSHMVKSVS